MRSGIFRRRIGACLACATLLSACAVSPDKTLLPSNTTTVANTSGTFINEGEPVFLTGNVSLPSYATSKTGDLTVQAERLAGGPLLGSSPAPVAADGTFSQLKVPLNSQLFFATVAFDSQNGPEELRALARAQPQAPLVIDVASSLIGARIAVAAQSRSLDALDYSATGELTDQVRATLGSSLASVDLGQPNAVLANKLTQLAQPHATLASHLADWENSFDPSPSPSPSASPSPSPTPEASAPPVK
ncbi:MAG TPA: hypothetical protein V6D47_15030 [Oscillatoriaceae cyanobacterium]